MAKKNTKSTKSVKVAPCECNKCGQKSHASPHTAHMSCIGFPLDTFSRFPALRGRLKCGEGKGGTWRPIVAEGAAA